MKKLIMEESESINEQEIKKRPLSLSVLCILTFVFSGLTCFSSLFIPVFSDLMVDLIRSNPDYDEALKAETIRLIKAGWGYYSVNFLLSFFSLTGAILMWKLKKIGFHFYALSNSALLFVPTLFFGITISWFGIFFAAGLIALYAFHLKEMS